ERPRERGGRDAIEREKRDGHHDGAREGRARDADLGPYRCGRSGRRSDEKRSEADGERQRGLAQVERESLQQDDLRGNEAEADRERLHRGAPADRGDERRAHDPPERKEEQSPRQHDRRDQRAEEDQISDRHVSARISEEDRTVVGGWQRRDSEALGELYSAIER